MTAFSERPVWAMAFRPFYLLSALYAAVSVLLWGFGYQGTSVLPSFYWHAHEMIWGYAGAVVVAFLLTAVATWTKQPPVHGRFLIVLTALWLAARVLAFVPRHWALAASGVCGTLFYWLSAYGMGDAVWKSRSTRNYIAVAALFMLGATHGLFHLFLHPIDGAVLHNGLISGLIMVAGFIGLVGNRIISFFTSRRLNVEQVQSPMWLMLSTLVLPMLIAPLLFLQAAWPFLKPVVGVLAIALGIINIIQSVRWFDKGVLREPMLWVLHIGYAFTALGLLFMGIGRFYSQTQSLGVHLLAVGGIGLLTIGMMTRTALGHTARPLYPVPKGLGLAFWLMVAASLMRALAAVMLYVHPTAYLHSYRCSAVLFAASMLIFFFRYLPWLLRPRLDGKPG
ncbi:NnrS family protein [Kingella sp. SNUBH-2017]|jgi:nnrS protein|uniref:NnrS family protein n=1 Tax=Kingella pumchi TaxID=2779506 RepID=A0ABS9NNE9_9NEIS|nr:MULTISPECIES: NnrS family protein [Kingella]MCG6504312.1 NnrS family protein [Kingella pumchi]MDD2183500.1 NnrS family protein [Kingella sp. SNUBH-2017]